MQTKSLILFETILSFGVIPLNQVSHVSMKGVTLYNQVSLINAVLKPFHCRFEVCRYKKN